MGRSSLIGSWLRELAPPLLWRAANRWRARATRGQPEWELIPEGWEAASGRTAVRGWEVPEVLAVYRRKWPRFLELVGGAQPLGLTHESDLEGATDLGSHNTIMAFGYALGRAALGRKRLSMLDWGGGIGHYFVLATALYPELEIDYHVKDVPTLAEHGAQLFPEQSFYCDETCLERSYDFVLASGSLHYERDWRRLLGLLAGATDGLLFVTRLPTVREMSTFAVLQRAYAYGYGTEYLGWCFNLEEFLAVAEESGLSLVREILVAESPTIAGAGERCQFRGFLFRRNDAPAS